MNHTLRMFEVVKIKNNLINKFNKMLKQYAQKEFIKLNKKPKSPESTEELYYRMGEKHTWDIIRRLQFEDLKQSLEGEKE